MKLETLKQIQKLTTKLLEKGFLQHNKTSIIKDDSMILWNDYDNISDIFDFDKYSDLYNDQLAKENYNFRMADGSLIQMMYRFSYGRNPKIIEHRLAYLPNPNSYIHSKYLGKYAGGDIKFGDLLYDDNLIVPVRIDYSNDDDKYIEYEHPYCHLTLGGHKDCRVAVEGPITPFIFIEFILRSFYRLIYNEVDIDFLENNNLFGKTISINELKYLYIGFK